ncbi:PBECR4 domain-containing protein [Fusobacterium animalis]|uniref:PBECR4 domain-containing protein n=1 Tax=Fusobacterium animalis TaxID=76859 RepID=UPI0034DF47FB
MDDKEILKKIRKAYFIYKEQFLNKDFYIVSRKNKNIEVLEIISRKEHFMHLVGVSGMSSKSFFEKIEKNTMSPSEFKNLKKSNFIFEKLNSFPKLKELLVTEPYLYDFHPHSTKKIELDKIVADKNREVDKSLIGLKMMKNSSQNFYIPASIEKRKASEITTEERKRIICILEKKSSEKDYSKILFRNLEENLSLYIPKEVFILIKKELEKVNYNCLTGEPIKIKNHSSGENKWIGKKDVEKFEIQKKSDVKEEIGKVAVIMTEKEMEDYKKSRGVETEEITSPSNEKKLYIIPVPYYNISDLKITKEIEQKFVPMKEKEKSQEIEKLKGQGIGD